MCSVFWHIRLFHFQKVQNFVTSSASHIHLLCVWGDEGGSGACWELDSSGLL